MTYEYRMHVLHETFSPMDEQGDRTPIDRVSEDYVISRELFNDFLRLNECDTQIGSERHDDGAYTETRRTVRINYMNDGRRYEPAKEVL